MTDIREGRGSNVKFNISGNNIREGRGSNVEFNISGNNIRKGRGSNVVCNSTGRLSNIEIIAVLFAMGEIRA